MLTRFGLSRAEAEDVAQETAAKALTGLVPFIDANDLYRWCYRVARNQAIDQFRHERFIDHRARMPEGAYVTDTARQVQAGIALQAVLREIDALPAPGRQLLLAAASGQGDDMNGAEQTMLSRTRARVRQRVAQLLGVIPGLRHPWRRLRIGKLALPLGALTTLSASMGLLFGPVGQTPKVALSPSPRSQAVLVTSAPAALSIQRGARPSATASRPTDKPSRILVARLPAPVGAQGSVTIRSTDPDRHIVCAHYSQVKTCIYAPKWPVPKVMPAPAVP